ncbi:MAG: saccharopine dehydrogenase NADP-binding domain-containing protein [Porticoccaceae bacterium]|nr:saccharopine dehydrogenase NADP-binding domain-containing protein [Porticoccaceae bacterium]MDG1474809.1 saccharopine dehydrogenase NADP-binding domain-containing protein [Porticoccaceae bacterium]
MTKRSFDIIVYGATSFVGQILTNYLVEHVGVGRGVSWAIAGRSASKLEDLKVSIGNIAQALPTIIADAEDPNALSNLAKSARVIATTVGPYALYGDALVKACAENGTDYCDLCGEAYWIKRMILQYGDVAKKSGARIVSCCGFDSIPSDLGVHFLQQQGKQRYGSHFKSIKLAVNAMKGGASGGTLASMIEAVKAAKADPVLRKEMNNPYVLCPEQASFKQNQISIKTPTYDEDFQAWSAPFIMEAINARVVLRSNMLKNMAYGDSFLYQEQVLTGKGLKGRLAAIGMTLGLGLFAVGIIINPIRSLLERFVLPKPGEGPSPEAQLAGYFDINLLGKTLDSQQLQVKVTGDRDPGYGCTAKMLAQASLCLAFDISQEQRGGGFWTPATAMGDQLIDRLNAHAGMSFSTL